MARLDHAQHFQRDHGFAQGGAGHPELLGQLPFGRQAVADLVLPGLDGVGDGVGDLAVELDVVRHDDRS